MKMQSNIEKVKKYIEYLKDKHNSYYYNPLELLNISEPSISQFLAWLFDAKNKEKDCIQYKFCEEFLKHIKVFENEEEIREFINNLEVRTEENEMDLLLLNSKTEQLIVIENKKRARLSYSKQDGEVVTQIEKYVKVCKDNYKNYKKCYFYLCGEKDDTECKISEKSPKNISIIDENKTIKNLLEDNGYKIITHNEIVRILYDIIKPENGIISPSNFDEMIEFARVMKNWIKPCKSKELLDIIFEEKNKCKYFGKTREQIKYTYEENLLPSILVNKNDFEMIFSKPKIYGNAVIQFRENIDKLDDDSKIKLLNWYIEYWELHRGIGGMSDNLEGYSKIIDGEYIYNVCKVIKLQDNSIWQSLTKYAENEKIADNWQWQLIVQYV